jgi:hypothetical protein
MMFLNKISKYIFDENLDVKWVVMFTTFISTIIISALILFSLNVFIKTTPKVAGIEIFSVTLLIAIASALVGMLLGFIFGIPRSHQISQNNGQGTGSETSELSHFSVNTNLEQISDWLTKIIVGVGLIEMNQISAGFYKLVTFFSKGIGLEQKETIIFVLIIASLVLGFLFGYLITRIYLTRAFSRVGDDTTEYKNLTEEEKKLLAEIQNSNPENIMSILSQQNKDISGIIQNLQDKNLVKIDVDKSGNLIPKADFSNLEKSEKDYFESELSKYITK